MGGCACPVVPGWGHFFVAAGISLNVLAPHIPHMFKAEAAKPSNPQPHHCNGLRPPRCCSSLGMGVGTSLCSARAADAGAALQKYWIPRWGKARGRAVGWGMPSAEPTCSTQGFNGDWQGSPWLELSLPVGQGWAVKPRCWVGLNRALWAGAPWQITHINSSLWLLLAARACRQSSSRAVLELLWKNRPCPGWGASEAFAAQPWEQVLRGVKTKGKSNHPRAWRGDRTVLYTQGASLKPCGYRLGGRSRHS